MVKNQAMADALERFGKHSRQLLTTAINVSLLVFDKIGGKKVFFPKMYVLLQVKTGSALLWPGTWLERTCLQWPLRVLSSSV